MNFTLKRSPAEADGVFGVLYDENDNQVAVTLEHAFDAQNGDGSYAAKVAPGMYTCLRHDPNRFPFVTWELQNVPPFQGKPVTAILLHPGNYNSDSDGCCLLGSHRNGSMIMDSKVTFNQFMELTKDQDSITLTIT